MSCKQKALKSAAPKRQFCGSASYTKADPAKGRGSEKQPYNEWPELLSSYHKFCVFIMVSDGLRSTLIWSKFSMLPDLPGTLCTIYARRNYAHRNWAHRISTPKSTLCMPPPLLKSLDPPLNTVNKQPTVFTGVLPLNKLKTSLQVRTVIFQCRIVSSQITSQPIHNYSDQRMASNR